MLTFRSTDLSQLDSVMEIIQDGIHILSERGVDQWQRGYPDRARLRKDIEDQISYVVMDDEFSLTEPVAVCAVTFGEEEDYKEMEGGSWLTDSHYYATVHRSAVRASCYGKGYPAFLFRQAEAMALTRGADSVRVDTHHENKAMRRTLEKAGYTPCGTIWISSGAEAHTPRIGYEKILSR